MLSIDTYDSDEKHNKVDTLQTVDESHQQQQIDRRYPCDQCASQFKSDKNLNEHKKTAHDGVRYSCDQCSYQATRKTTLKTHKQSVHDGVRYFCDQCRYKTGWPEHFYRHLKEGKHKKPKLIKERRSST